EAKSKDPALKEAGDQLAAVQKILTELQKAEQEKARQASAREAADSLAKEAAAVDAANKQLAQTRMADDLARQGLVALFKGDTQNAIDPLSKAAAMVKDDPGRLATVTGYLGVAYATKAFQSADPRDQADNRTKALQAFRDALNAQPTFTLPSTLVSPRVQK